MTNITRRLGGAVAAVIVVTTTALLAQTMKIAPVQNALFILADQTARLQSALDQAAGAGLHVVFAASQGIFLKRPSQGADAPGYRAIITGRPATLEKELNAGGEQGFRAMPQTLTDSGNDTLVIMSRASGVSTKYSYRVLEWDGAFEKNLSGLAAKGFSPIGVFADASSMSVKLGRPGRLQVVLQTQVEGSSSPAAVVSQPRVVSAVRTSALEKEINEVAAGGYRATAGSLMSVMLAKADDPSTTYTYRVVGAIRGNTLVDEIQKAGREGYRVVPSAIMNNPGQRGETVLVMERSAAPSRSYEYEFVDPDAKDVGLFFLSMEEKELTPVALFLHIAHLIVFEKAS